MIISMPPREGAFTEMVVMRDENPCSCPMMCRCETALAELLACGWHAVRLGSTILDMPLRDANATSSAGWRGR
jgi:L-iditol 2-dehydrogenase